MNQPPETTALLNLGLNRYEAGAYVALTRRGRATGAEVARLAALPRQRIYDVLDGLVDRGLATVEPGRPAYYAAVDPEHAVALLLDGHRTALQEFEQEAVRAVALLGPAYRDGRAETDPLNYIEVLREPGAIARRFGELQASAQRELLIFTKPPYAVEPGTPRGSSSFHVASSREASTSNRCTTIQRSSLPCGASSRSASGRGSSTTCRSSSS